MKNDSDVSPRDGAAPDSRWKEFFALLVVAWLAAVAAVPAEMAALSAVEGGVSWWAPLLAFLVWAAPSTLAVGVGVRFGETLGLGAPVARGWSIGEADLGRRIRSLLPATLIAGIGISVVLRLVGPWLEAHLWPEMPEHVRQAIESAGQTAGWRMVLASFAGGICEELVFRFGLMTMIVSLGVRLTRYRQPGAILLWTANLLAAAPFALVHLVNAVGLGIPITFGLIVIILILNGAAGIVFGWLYARRGIEAAMLAHFLVDFIQFLVWPIFENPGV